jgi:hypothetical protein
VSRLLTELTAGHVFEPITFTITDADNLAYREAVGEMVPASSRAAVFVPALAVAALALGKLLEQVQLPPGSLHASESLAFNSAVPAGSHLECRARLSQRSVRAGWVVSVLDTDTFLEGAPAVSGRATILSPATSQ